MNPSLLTASAALVLGLLWITLRRRPVTLLRSTDASAIAALNRAQIGRPLAPNDAASPLAAGLAHGSPATGLDSGPGPDSASHAYAEHRAAAALSARPLPAPGQARERAALLRQLQGAMVAAAPQRLAAIQLAARWGDPAVLPLLRRGLRDVDPAVVGCAAAAMAPFRTCPRLRQARQAAAQPASLPRNVARTR